MIDGGRLVGGTFLALVLGAGPAWVASSGGTPGAELSPPIPGSTCIAPKEVMRSTHPGLLAEWRDQVVRTGNRAYHTPDGRELRVSLSGTCLGCHGSAATFCDRCHAEAGRAVTCWSCHPSTGTNRQ